MRKITLGIVATIAATAGLAAPAAAQNYYGGGWNGSPYDTNRDGRVDARENQAARRDNGTYGYDPNGGFSPYDFNRDGRVDARENQVALRDNGYGGYGGQSAYRGYGAYNPYDLNRDGRVTRREMRQAQRMQQVRR